MKTNKKSGAYFKRTAIALALSAVFSGVNANVDVNNEVVNVLPAKVYQAVSNETLHSVTSKISLRSQIKFKINPLLAKDKVDVNLSGDTWDSVTRDLLKYYNYVSSVEGNEKLIIITGRKFSGSDLSKKEKSVEISDYVVTVTSKELPKEFRSFSSKQAQVVDIPADEIANLDDGETFTLDLPIGSFKVTKESTQVQSDNSKVVMGHLLTEGKGYKVSYSKGEGGLLGSVMTPEGEYAIEQAKNGENILIKVENQGLNNKIDEDMSVQNDISYQGLCEFSIAVKIYKKSNADCLTTRMGPTLFARDVKIVTTNDFLQEAGVSINDIEKEYKTPDGTVVEDQAGIKVKNRSNRLLDGYGRSRNAVPISDTAPVVDVMLYYTVGVFSEAYTRQRAYYSVFLTNHAFADSGAKVKLRLVHIEKVDYSELVHSSDALFDMVSQVGVFSDVENKRSQYGADLVVLMRPPREYDYCGSTNGPNSPDEFLDSSHMFSEISTGIVGISSTCSSLVFPHEIGHSFGLGHDYEDSKGSYDSLKTYAWSSTNIFDHQNDFGTIMSYVHPRLALYSTKRLKTECRGRSCGNPDGSTEQVPAITKYARTIANYRPTVVPF